MMKREFFFLTGFPKSGTTWMMNMLNDLKDACCLGEGRFFSSGLRDVPSLFDALTAGIQPWYEHVSNRKKNWLEFDPYIKTINKRNYVSRNDFSRVFAEDVVCITRMTVQGLMSRLAEKQPAVRFVGDKTPIMDAGALDRIVRVFPDAKIIYMERDIRDVIVSLLFHYWRSMKGASSDCHMNYLTVDDFLQVDSFVNARNNKVIKFAKKETAISLTKLWKALNKRAHIYATNKSGSVLIISYEKLKAKPFEEMKKALTFLGIKVSRSELSEIIERNSKETVGKGRNSYLKTHIRSGEAGDWSNYLDDEICAAIDMAKMSGVRRR